MKKSPLFLILLLLVFGLSSYTTDLKSATEKMQLSTNASTFTKTDEGYFVYSGQEYHVYGDGAGNLTEIWKSTNLVDQSQETLISGTYYYNSTDHNTHVDVIWHGTPWGHYIGIVYF